MGPMARLRSCVLVAKIHGDTLLKLSGARCLNHCIWRICRSRRITTADFTIPCVKVADSGRSNRTRRCGPRRVATSRVENLSLSGTGLTDDSLRLICHSTTLKSLAHPQLAENPGAGFDGLVDSNLETLRIHGTPIAPVMPITWPICGVFAKCRWTSPSCLPWRPEWPKLTQPLTLELHLPKSLAAISPLTSITNCIFTTLPSWKRTNIGI